MAEQDKDKSQHSPTPVEEARERLERQKEESGTFWDRDVDATRDTAPAPDKDSGDD